MTTSIVTSPRSRHPITWALFGLGLIVGGTACTKRLDPPRSPDAATRPGSPAPASAPAAPSGPPEPPEEDGPITDHERAAVIDALGAALQQHYVFPDKAVAIGKALHDHLQRGDYAKLTTAATFARAVSADMVALVHDKHLEVRYVQKPVAPTAGDQPPEQEAEEAAEMQYVNHGIFEVRRMRFNIGYLNFNLFGRPAGFADKLAAAMRLLHDTQSLIVDLRECHGGDTDAVALAESYLVPANTHLLDMYTRTTDTTEHVRATAELAGPRYPAGKPVLILISEGTVSGCEAFAYAMQAQQRATVIGAPSAGAAYFGDPRRLTDHFMAFVPVGRPIDPITHGDWEGTGVTPQIAAAPAKALDVAELKSLQVLQPQEPSRRRQAAMQKRMAELN